MSAPIAAPLVRRSLACGGCGARFACGEGGRDGGCWCMDEAARLPMPDAAVTADCLCPACLRTTIERSSRRPA